MKTLSSPFLLLLFLLASCPEAPEIRQRHYNEILSPLYYDILCKEEYGRVVKNVLDNCEVICDKEFRQKLLSYASPEELAGGWEERKYLHDGLSQYLESCE